MAGGTWLVGRRSLRPRRGVAIGIVVAVVIGTLTSLASPAAAGPGPTSPLLMARQDTGATWAVSVPGTGSRDLDRAAIGNTPRGVANSPGGSWNHLHLTRTNPFASLTTWIGTFTVQYNYRVHVLMWSTHLAPTVIVLFHMEEVEENYAVWVETQGIKFSDSHLRPPTYTFHSSLTSYKYGGRGMSFSPMPGQWFEIEFVALNNWGIVGMKESVSIGR